MALCAITFLAWLLRVRDNARSLSGQPPRYAWPWIYAGWIVPVANLWMPRGIVADIHRASAPGERLPRAVTAPSPRRSSNASTTPYGTTPPQPPARQAARVPHRKRPGRPSGT
ncbi:hypothetical protein QFZ67_000376 [Streptomyces sp. V1I1]|nr:DUF4328 domain-containing protein [Streptomyces sp. V1I1]MDQ0938671.1 hypothetical protein [Streptomyces sp. V1I1]